MKSLSLQKVIQRYFKNNIPFALFRYPGTEIQLIAQYADTIPIYELNVAELPKGFLIHPFFVADCPILFILPHIFTSDFDSINLDEVRNLKDTVPYSFNETIIKKSTYLKHIEQFKKQLSPQGLKKAIYSRIVGFPPIAKPQLLDCFLSMEKLHLDAFCYLLHLPRYGIWLGTTPERLLSYQNELAKTVALAGTQKLSESTIWGEKEKEEQGFVSTYIQSLIKQFDLKLVHQSELETIQAGNLKHLKTSFEIDLPKEKINAFLNALHPTPAVGGFPQKEAIKLILQTEIHDRQFYAGYLGMVNTSDDFDLFVNLRCAKVTDLTTLAFAGGGITASSVAEDEWIETKNKSETIGRILI